MRGPLSLSIERDGQLLSVSKRADGVSFAKTAPGGHAHASARLTLPAGSPRLRPTDRFVITATETGAVVWDGYTEWPNPAETEGLVSYEISALGGRSLLADEVRPQFYVDTVDALDASAWWPRPLTGPGAQASVSSVPTQHQGDEEIPAALVQFPSGMAVGPNTRSGLEWQRAGAAGVDIQYVALTLSYGGVWVNTACSVYAGSGSGWGSVPALSRQMEFDGGTFALLATVHGGTLPSGTDRLRLLLARTGGGDIEIAGDRAWAAWSNLSLGSRLRLRNGSFRPFDGGFNFGTVRAHMVVEDLLYRMAASHIDLPRAAIESTTYDIGQLARPDGATAASMLDDLALWEPDHLWEVGAQGPDGRHSFAYRQWPTEVRYVFGGDVEWNEPGGEVDLCNRIQITWNGPNGSPQSRTVTAAVPELDEDGRVRHMESFSLPAGMGSTQNAIRIGTALLAANNSPLRARTARVARPVYDRAVARMVQPWELEPGFVARWDVDGVELRVTEVSYDDDSATATVTAGEPALTADQRLARLSVGKQP